METLDILHDEQQERRDNVIRLAFNGDTRSFEEFVRQVREAIPEANAGVLRGSAVTGYRWKDNAPFDADGPGTSDLDLTLIGPGVLDHYALTGYYIPGVHSRPLSDFGTDVAPDLVPLRRRLMAMVNRPVNIQGTRDWVQYFRGEVLEQPYLLLFGHLETGSADAQ